ncbi:MAG: hypothetical protein Q7S65_00875 [Nanoarchaeota archaeon]|nr:hypothetical protein [Nanoarchaeota archaeon]
MLKDLQSANTITSLAQELKLSRVGAWKIAKRLENQEFVVLTQMGKGKTNTNTIALNWGNLLLEKTLEMVLTQEALQYPRWRSSFVELEPSAEFLLLFGSVLHSEKEAKDIDLLAVCTQKNKLRNVIEGVADIQTTQAKEIHTLSMTETELESELKKNTPAIHDALKKGVVLFGQDKFIKFMKRISKP